MITKYKLVFVGHFSALLFSVALMYVYQLYILPTSAVQEGNVSKIAIVFAGFEYFFIWELFSGLFLISIIAPIVQRYFRRMGMWTIAAALTGQLLVFQQFSADADGYIPALFIFAGVSPALILFLKAMRLDLTPADFSS